MKNRILSFKYSRSFRIVNWGFSFDSLTELKFAVSVMEDFEFMQQPVSIYYDPTTKIPVKQVQLFHRRYTPDFLIRNRQTGEAFLIEIKPRSFEIHPSLRVRRRVAENFISMENLDWKFKIVFDDEIVLTSDQLEQFEQCFKLNSKSAWKSWFERYHRRLNHDTPTLSFWPSQNRRVQFLMFGSSNRFSKSKWK